MKIKLSEVKRIVRKILENVNNDDIVDLLERWADHVYHPMTRDELIKFASRAMRHPLAFSYGPDVPRVNVYRGYRDMDDSGIQKLLGEVPHENSGIYKFRSSTRDMSWSPILDVAFNVADPIESKWSAVAKTDTSSGSWLSPGPKFEKFVMQHGVSLSAAKMLSSEYLQVTPGRRPGKIAVVKYESNRDYEDVARELDELSMKL